MPLTITSSIILPLDTLLDRVITVEDMRAVGELARLQIVQRTKHGVPPEGISWPAYSPEYAARKAAAPGVGPGPVNLTVSGEMLDTLRIRDVSRTHVTLGWAR